jgi:phage replication-related protein YjqB (UPF0714/DUF867 family)
MKKSKEKIKVFIMPRGVGQFFNSKYTLKQVKDSFDYVSALDQINKQAGKKHIVIGIKKDKAVMIGELLQRKGYDVEIYTYSFLKKFLK